MNNSFYKKANKFLTFKDLLNICNLPYIVINNDKILDVNNIKDANNKAVAVYKFNKTLLDGYNASQDVANIIKPPPKLTPEEQKLVDKASGETKSPTEVVGEARTTGASNPWLLIVGAVAAAALLS